MAVVSNDPGWWPVINGARFFSYFMVAACVGGIYDWALTFGQEVELVWRQRWSLMTILYLCARYLGILYAVFQIFVVIPTVPLTDSSCYIIIVASDWVGIIVNTILDVIMLTRLYAMYQRSNKVLILLVVILLVVTVSNGVLNVMATRNTSAEELILSGTYECSVTLDRDSEITNSMTWIVGIVWEVLVLCLAVWIAVKHFRELRRHSAGGIVGDCFTVLMNTHLVYFLSFVAVSCFQISGYLSPTLTLSDSTATQFYNGCLGIFIIMQMFVLGPRLILGVREYHVKLIADSDAATDMASIAFQERVHMTTSGSV